jgi:prepilin-type N-terminal cleavage/methylation domain-containing protein
MTKNKKIGFTLPELLIVLSIIGVVAALAVPQVGYEMQKKRNALILGRSIEQVETGCKSLVLRFNSQSNNGGESFGYSSIYIPGSTSTFMTGTNLFGTHDGYSNAALFELGNVLNASSNITGYTPKTYGKTSNMTASGGLFALNGLYPSEKTGAYIGIGGTFSDDSNGTNASSDDPIEDIIYIDVNAENKPNELGKDIFVFGLGDSCKMYPAGSQKMITIGYPALSSNDTCEGSSQGTGLACAERVVKDGFKIDY